MLSEQRYTEYDPWAWLYNHTMGVQYCKKQLQPISLLLLSHLPANAHLLDLCCGTGQLMQLLLEQGYQVTGLDGSDAMLHYARQNAPQAQLISGDARHFELPPIFDGVFSTSASLNHMMSLKELKAVFHNVYAALKDGGVFLFDLNHALQMKKWWRGQVVEAEVTAKFAWSITPVYEPNEKIGNFKVTLFQAPQSTKSPQKNRFYFSSLITPLKATLRQLLYKLLSLRLLTYRRLKLLAQFQDWEPNWQKQEVVYQVRGYTPTEVKLALEETRFTDIKICTLDGRSPIDENHSAYFLCHKPFV